jgi:hypothetical protein
MDRTSRREFLADVGRGMLVASVGSTLASDLGLSSVMAAEESHALTFGSLEPLVTMMQQTPAAKLLPAVVKTIQSGTDLKTLVAAAALANARTFGGQDYDGFHTFMALAPAWHMSKELPEARRAMPVLKVLYRNTARIQNFGGHDHEILHLVDAAAVKGDAPTGETIRACSRKLDFDSAEQAFATIAKSEPGEAFNHLQYAMQDEVDVHRVVLAWRAWDTLGLTGKEHAHTLLRQSVRYCVNSEKGACDRDKAAHESRINSMNHVRHVLPKLLDQYQLVSKPTGTRRVDDAWIEKMCNTIVTSNREVAADAVAAALADGISPEDIGEAISLAANALLLRDTADRTHGDSKGVHASDSANAWRNIARVSNHRNAVASLIVGAYHTAGQGGNLHKQPLPFAEHLEKFTGDDPAALLKQTEGAIRENNQTRACAAIYRYGQLGHAPRGVFDLLLKYAISEDGRLHAEKYYRTVSEEFASMRPAFRWRQLTALARVTASSFAYTREDKHGHRAPGYDEACKLLGIDPSGAA